MLKKYFYKLSLLLLLLNICNLKAVQELDENVQVSATKNEAVSRFCGTVKPNLILTALKFKKGQLEGRIECSLIGSYYFDGCSVPDRKTVSPEDAQTYYKMLKALWHSQQQL